MEFKKGDRVECSGREGVFVQYLNDRRECGIQMDGESVGWCHATDLRYLFQPGDVVRVERVPTEEEQEANHTDRSFDYAHYFGRDGIVSNVDSEGVNCMVRYAVDDEFGFYLTLPTAAISLIRRAGEEEPKDITTIGARYKAALADMGYNEGDVVPPEVLLKAEQIAKGEDEPSPEVEAKGHAVTIVHPDGLPQYTCTAVFETPQGGRLEIPEPGDGWEVDSVADYSDEMWTVCTINGDWLAPTPSASEIVLQLGFKQASKEVLHPHGVCWLREYKNIPHKLRVLSVTTWKRNPQPAEQEPDAYKPSFPVIAEFLS